MTDWQGLKPDSFCGICGMAKAMPCYKAAWIEFFRSLSCPIAEMISGKKTYALLLTPMRRR